MSEHKKFDDYIKGLFEENPRAPSDLDWESMNFDLPEVPKSEKDSKKKYLLLLLLLFIGVPALYFGILKSDETNPPLTEVNSNQNLEETANNQLVKKELAAKKSAEISMQNNTSTPESEVINTASSVAQNSVLNKLDKNKLMSENPLKSSISPLEENEKQVNENSKNVAKSKENIVFSSNSTSLTVSKKKEDEKSEVALLPRLPLTALPIASFENIEEKLNIKPLKEKDDKKTSFKINRVFAGYGYNTFNLKSDFALTLIDNPTSTWGKSFTAGFNLNLNKKWNSSLRFNYNQYHSIFEYSRDLEPIIDTLNLIKTNREELTYHNNYTQTLGLQIGVDRQFQITEKISFYAGLTLSPTYILSARGKALADDIPAVFENNIGAFTLNSGLNTGLVFPISRFIDLEFNYQFNQSFSKKVFINNGVYSNQQSVFSVIVGHKF